VRFNADLDVDDSVRKVRDALGNIKNELPEDAGEPVVGEVSLDDTPILSVALSGDYDGFTLYNYAKDIKDELEKIPGAREVDIAGGDRREIEINYSPEKLNYYGITLPQANNAIAAANIDVPSGNLKVRFMSIRCAPMAGYTMPGNCRNYPSARPAACRFFKGRRFGKGNFH